MATEEEKLSPVETAKIASEFLRGQIAEELVDGNDHFGKDSVQLLKNHGTYQQDDRDTRAASRASHGAKSDKAYTFMVRTKIPGGKLTSEQMLAELDLCDEVGNTTLRITSRQGLQLHGVIKSDLKRTIRRINDVQLSTLAACGDVERNVMCCPAPHYHDPVHADLQKLADGIAQHLCPRTRAYHEIWLTDGDSGEKTLVGGGAPEEIEPIYGPTYLPRKFKTAIGLCGDNCVDIYTNDLGLLAVCEDYKIIGYNVLVGGGMGVTPSAKKTFPALAKRMAFIRPEQAIDVATAVVMVQRDYGNRADRKVARLKYLIANQGLPWFKAKVEEYYGQPLEEPHPDDVRGFDDHMGWHEQGDGRWFYGLNVENGRILDGELSNGTGLQLKAALREICNTYRPGIRLTPHQSILFTDIEAQDRQPLEDLLRRHRVKLSHEISNARRWSMACVAWPTCGLAITESERALPGIIDQIEPELARLGLSTEKFTIRMTGCPNACARPYNCDVGLVGKTVGKYTIYVGGRLLGDRLNFIYKDLVPGEEIVAELKPLLVFFKHARESGESFGDFCHRQRAERLLAWADEYRAGNGAGI
ncbi:MAG TPA: NADPH-dependent assimilatory sulfite reductase hemoprotein subunit [Pirellulales bacterium]|jgi:sulfite reductase (ferredoxin)|nr:NADPH-dependent assimilatory sulfite reductase hemoprotein subunit [Pirellulales bacterium]